MKELVLFSILSAMAVPALAADPTFNIEHIVHWFVVMIVVAVIFGILLFLVRRAPFIDAMIKQVIEYILWFLLAMAAIAVLLGMIGHPLF